MKSTDRKTARLVIMVSLQERAEIARAASEMGYAESTYARATLLQHARTVLTTRRVVAIAQNVPITVAKDTKVAVADGSDATVNSTTTGAAPTSNVAVNGTAVSPPRHITGKEYDTYCAERATALREGREFPDDHTAWLAEYRARPGYVYVSDSPRDVAPPAPPAKKEA